MGGGMMGGGMMGGLMSVPSTDLPSAALRPRETRRLPTRYVLLGRPDVSGSIGLPQKDEPLRILGDVGVASQDEQVQKALAPPGV